MDFKKPIIPSVVRGHQIVSLKPTDSHHRSDDMRTGMSHLRQAAPPGGEFQALLNKHHPMYSSFSPDGVFRESYLELHARLVEAKRCAIRQLTSPAEKVKILMQDAAASRAGSVYHLNTRAHSSLPPLSSSTLRNTASTLPDHRTISMAELDALNAADPICFANAAASVSTREKSPGGTTTLPSLVVKGKLQVVYSM